MFLGSGLATTISGGRAYALSYQNLFEMLRAVPGNMDSLQNRLSQDVAREGTRMLIWAVVCSTLIEAATVWAYYASAQNQVWKPELPLMRFDAFASFFMADVLRTLSLAGSLVAGAWIGVFTASRKWPIASAIDAFLLYVTWLGFVVLNPKYMESIFIGSAYLIGLYNRNVFPLLLQFTVIAMLTPWLLLRRIKRRILLLPAAMERIAALRGD